MHGNNIESIINRLSNIINNTPDVLPNENLANQRLFNRDETSFYLIGDNLDVYNTLLEDLLLKERWDKKFSEKYVDSVLQDEIFNILKYGVRKAIESFSKTCNEVEVYSIQQTVYIPLSGITMFDVEEFSLGRVNFKRITKAILEEILEAAETVIRKTKNLPEEQELFIKESNESLSNEFSEKVCAVYQVVAEPNRARELAEQETQLALDLLRYSIPVLYRDESIVRIGLSSQVTSIYQPALTLSSVGLVQDRTLLNRNYEISRNNITVLRKIGVFEMSDILTKPYEQLSDFKKTLLRGVHWFANSQTQTKIENEFLNLIICLEVFFTQKGGDPISSSIAEGTALILGSNLTERKRLKSRVKELYGLRSVVSHGEHSSILNKDVVDLKFIAMRLLVKMIGRREDFISRRNLIDWLEEQRLS